MIILDIVEDTIPLLTPAPPFSFIHGPKGWMNLKADEAEKDIVWLGYPITGNDAHQKTGAVETSWPMQIFFGGKSTISGDDNIDQIRVVVSRMMTYALQFELRLRADSRVKTVTNCVRNEVHSLTDRALAGCFLTCTVVTYNESSVCIE